jgi:hypothetical protein
MEPAKAAMGLEPEDGQGDLFTDALYLVPIFTYHPLLVPEPGAQQASAQFLVRDLTTTKKIDNFQSAPVSVIVSLLPRPTSGTQLYERTGGDTLHLLWSCSDPTQRRGTGRCHHQHTHRPTCTTTTRGHRQAWRGGCIIPTPSRKRSLGAGRHTQLMKAIHPNLPIPRPHCGTLHRQMVRVHRTAVPVMVRRLIQDNTAGHHSPSQTTHPSLLPKETKTSLPLSTEPMGRVHQSAVLPRRSRLGVKRRSGRARGSPA